MVSMLHFQSLQQPTVYKQHPKIVLYLMQIVMSNYNRYNHTIFYINNINLTANPKRPDETFLKQSSTKWMYLNSCFYSVSW